MNVPDSIAVTLAALGVAEEKTPLVAFSLLFLLTTLLVVGFVALILLRKFRARRPLSQDHTVEKDIS